jgi:hypothetical protein
MENKAHPAETSVLVQRKMDCRLIAAIPINGIKKVFQETSPDSMLGFFAFGPKPKGRSASTQD